MSTSHLCPSRIVPRCLYFVYFALVVWLDMQIIMSDCFYLHVRMNIYLLYVHWSHSLMTTLVWSSLLFTWYLMFTNLITLYLRLYIPCVQLVTRLECQGSVQKVFRRYLATKHPVKRKHVTCTWLECQESVQMVTARFREYIAGKAFPRDTRETFCSARLYYLITPFCTLTIYKPSLSTNVKESFWEKTLAKTFES